MKKILLILSTFFIIQHVLAQTEILNNQSVLDMVGLGFSEEVIIAKIKNSNTDFDTSIEALKIFKEKGLSDNIITTILNNSKFSCEEDSIVEEKRKLGIFINEDGEIRKILPTVFSGTKTNTLGSSLSYGLASSSIKTVLNNSTSINITRHSRPEFIFFFARPSDQTNNNGSNWYFFSAESPNEFVLVKLSQRKRTRELQTGSVNIYAGVNRGIDENNTIPFDIINIDDYTYKVVPKEPLENGEYCFFYQGAIPQGGYNMKSVFDFSLQAEKILSKYNVEQTVWTLIKGQPKRCDISDVKFKNEGFYYTLLPHFSSKEIIRTNRSVTLLKRSY